MHNGKLEKMDAKSRFLVEQSMAMMEALYDEREELLRDEERPERHNTRGSVHYALGLLIRGAQGDAALAEKLLHRVMDLQFDAPGEIYDGTYRTAPQAAFPPGGHYGWRDFGPGLAFFLNDTFEKMEESLVKSMARDYSGLDDEAVATSFKDAVASVIPQVWRSFDPNWREFIVCAFAVILSHFEKELPAGLVSRMDASAKRAVAASIERRLSDAIPMNSNIELMHVFIVHYFGYRHGNETWIRHADRQLSSVLAEFREFGSFAEFNTTTYYGVDLTVLGLWRQYGRTPSFLNAGAELEAGLWRSIARFYNPSLANLSGPFARAYEMEMTGHSSIGVFLYLALGEKLRHLTGINCETSHDPLIALAGVNIPEDVLPALSEHAGDRFVSQRFRELCERDRPGQNRNLCTASAWIERDRMLGAMSGSRNTNGQMHAATIHWRGPDGGLYYLRLLRREKGKSWNSHLRGIILDAAVRKDELDVVARINNRRNIEVYYEITGPDLSEAELAADRWRLPGLICRVEGEMPQPAIVWGNEKAEIIYAYSGGSGEAEMRFGLRFDPLLP